MTTAGPPVGLPPSPPAHYTDAPIRESIGMLTVAGKSFKKIQETVKSLYGDNALKRTQIYDIIKKGEGGETEDRPEGFQHEEAS
jgi:hypothetical protein